MINRVSILNRAKYLAIFQNYLVFIPAKNYIKYFCGATQINLWKSNGMSDKKIENTTRSDSNFTPNFVDHHVLADINFNGHCLINNKISISIRVMNIWFFWQHKTEKLFGKKVITFFKRHISIILWYFSS